MSTTHNKKYKQRESTFPLPAWRSMSSFREMDISSSTVHGLLTWPLMQNSFVPWLFFRPNDENHSGPLRKIVGATATVSTFVTVEGHPYSPTFAGNGGLSRGFPWEPKNQSMIRNRKNNTW